MLVVKFNKSSFLPWWHIRAASSQTKCGLVYDSSWLPTIQDIQNYFGTDSANRCVFCEIKWNE